MSSVAVLLAEEKVRQSTAEFEAAVDRLESKIHRGVAIVQNIRQSPERIAGVIQSRFKENMQHRDRVAIQALLMIAIGSALIFFRPRAEQT